MTDVMRDDRVVLLERLYRQELSDKADAYLLQHAHRNSVLRQASVFERYFPHLPSTGVFLDWGCRHAPDSCLLRHALGDRVELHGCDFTSGAAFPRFHEYARLEYRQLAGFLKLPYGDGTFDVVIGGGVLEHTANDSIALQELHRCLREDGLLVLTFVPNRLSYTEFLARRFGLGVTHARLYGRTELRRMLLHHGFVPIAVDNHQMVPAHRLQGVFGGAWWMNDFLERAWPLSRLSANLMFVCRRRRSLL